MKNLTKILLVFFIFNLQFSSAQDFKSITLLKSQFGFLSCEYSMEINSNDLDTSFFVTLIFQNQEYRYLKDIKIIRISSKEDLHKLVFQLKESLPEIKKRNSNQYWIGSGYSLMTSENISMLYIFKKEDGNDGYIMMNYKNTEKLINWLEYIINHNNNI